MDEEKKKPKSIEQLGNYIKQDMAKDFQKKAKENPCPVTTASAPEQHQFLAQCLMHMPRGEHKQLLLLRLNGYDYKYISNQFRVPVGVVKQLEQEAIKKAKDAIYLANKWLV